MCRKKKIKCDGKLPACTHCINYKTECVFTQVEKKRNPPKGYDNCSPVTDISNVSQCEIYRGPGEPTGTNGKSTEAFWYVSYLDRSSYRGPIEC